MESSIVTLDEMKSLPDDKQKEIISRIKSVRTNYKVVNTALS